MRRSSHQQVAGTKVGDIRVLARRGRLRCPPQ
jgi:hypothetical protein